MRGRGCGCVGRVRVVGGAGCEKIHKDESVQRVTFLFTLQERRGAWCGRYTGTGGGGFELFLNYGL